MTSLPKFLILRFAPGAAGNMISSLLQCSPEVAHWSPEEQRKKPNNNWLEYFQRAFPKQLDKWVYHEPVGQLNWGTREIFSAKYPRGNDISTKDFFTLEKVHCNHYYHQQKKLGSYLPIFWHKTDMPEYFTNGKAIIVKIDKESLRWFDRAVYHKHYKIKKLDKQGIQVQCLEHRPEIVPKRFRNMVQFEQRWPSFRSFVAETIFDNPYRALYQTPELFAAWPIPTLTIKLTQLLDPNQIFTCYQDICGFLNISASLSAREISLLHSYWRNLHAV